MSGTRWKPYLAYKDSRVAWLGEVPSHWMTAGFKYVAQLNYGDSLPADSREIGDIPVFGSNGAVGTHSESNTLAPVIVVGRKGSYGKVNFSSEPVLAIDTTFYIDSRFTKADLRWLYYTIPLLELDTFSQDSAVPGLSREFAYSQRLPIPPLSEQRAIAAFLDRETARIDALIVKKERLIELLQEKRAALISHAVTKGLDSGAEMKDSGVAWLGEVPAHWEVKRLKFMVRIQSGVTKGRDLSGRQIVDLPYLRVANVQDGFLDLSDMATITVAIDEIERYSLMAGDVLMTEGGDNDKLGRGTIWQGQIEPCLHQNHIFAVRPQGVDSRWISVITLTDYAKFYFMSMAKQSTNLASISSTNLKELPVLLPPPEEQRQIMRHIDSETARIDALITKVREAIDKLHEYRTALITAAVTGKIDIREEV